LTEQNLVIERLKERKNRSTGMLTGWLHDLVSRHAAPGATVVPYVPFRTPFRPLTQKTAASGEQSSNLVHRQLFSGFARSVAQKFEDVKTLVPYVSKITGEKMKTWDEVERVFPGAALSGSSRHEEPLQPGEMRSGTVIQKFDMFPKPGQPIESFKAQSTQTTSRTRTKEAAPQKKALTPGQRLFSRVTEITPNKSYESQSEIADEFEEPETTLPQPFEQPEHQTVFPEPSQAEVEPEPRLMENEPELQTPDEPVKQALAKEVSENITEPKPPKPSDSPVEMPLHRAPGREEPARPEKREAKKEESREKPLIAVSKAQPVAPLAGEKLPKAIPVRKESERQEKVHRALPATGKTERIPLHAHQSPITSRVVQRSPDFPDTPVQKELMPPETGEEQKTISAQQMMPTLTETDISFSSMPRIQGEKSGEDQESRSSVTDVEMPLRKVVQRRQQVSRGLVQATKGVQLAPAAQQPPLVQHAQSPLFSPQKYQMELNTGRFDAQGEEKTESSVSALPLSFNYPRNLPASSQERAASFNANIPERDAENRPAPSMMQNDLSVLQPSQMQSQPITPESFVMLNQKRQPQISTSGEMQRGATSASAQSNNVVQRVGASPEQPATPPPTPPTDLGQLADDVLPFVKRLLEIERERTRGSFR
jgi:hypothetical protein